MFSRQRKLISIFILLLGLAAWQAALAGKPVKVTGANPPDAEQGVTNYKVTISGSDFEAGNIATVRFLLPCSGKACSGETGGVTVDSIDNDTSTSTEVTAYITVADSAVVDYRDIEVQMRSGRGGKGTTLFRVKEKTTGGPEYTTCSEEYFGGVSGICMDVDGGECDLVLGNPPRIKKLTEDCVTHATIVLPATGALNSDGNVTNPADYRTLTAIGSPEDPFIGDSVITNDSHSAQVRGLNIVIGSGVPTATDCDNNPEGYLATGIRFVLDEDTDETPPGGGTLLYVAPVSISTNSGPLCEAIVVARRSGYAHFSSTVDWKTYVSGNTIQPFSYTRTGIRFEGFRQQQNINPPGVDYNVVGAPDCTDHAVGIIYGPLNTRESSSASETLLAYNTVSMQGASCPDTTGIRLLGNGTTDLTGDVSNNSVTGGRIGVEIAVDAATDSVNMKGNTLSGDGGGDAGVCSNVAVSEKGKPNRISGYALDFESPPCDGQ